MLFTQFLPWMSTRSWRAKYFNYQHDGLKGFPEAIAQAFPKTEIPLCIVHQVCTSLKYGVSTDQKLFMADLKPAYPAVE